MTKERKEILVLDGITILAIVMIVVNGTIAALMYRWHNTLVFRENVEHQQAFADLLAEERRLKNLVVEREGAESWEASDYGKTFEFRVRGKMTFEHEATSIAFDYPGDYVKSGEGGKDRLVLMSAKDAEELAESAVPRESPPTITADIYPLNRKKLPDWLRTSAESNFSLSNGEYTSDVVGNIPALIYQWSGLYEATTYAFQLGDHVLLLSVTYFSRGDDIVRDFDLILSTLRKV